MKKLVMTVAVLAVAGIVSAQVYSSNIVGYAKKATPAAGGFNMITLTQFGNADTINIQDAIANVQDLNASAVKANADKLYLWTGSGYAAYGLYFKSSTSQIFWMAVGSAGWSVPTLASPANVTISRGSAAWIETGAGGSSVDALVAGEVPNDGTYDVALSGNFNMVSFPYTAPINLNSLVVGNAASSSVKANADKIYLWTGSGYAAYGLYYKASTLQTFWLAVGSAGWSVPTLATPSSAVIDLGDGFWYESVNGAKTISFSQNY